MPAQTPIPSSAQVVGDCQLQVCDGLGAIVGVVDDNDLPDDGNACTSEACSLGMPSFIPLASGSACGSGVCDGNGACLGCVQATDCGSGTFCQSWTCDAGSCNQTFTTSGTALPQQAPNDCLVEQCDGQGGTMHADDDSDLPLDDGNECTAESCVGGLAEHVAKPADTACTQNGGVCDGAGTCVQCNTPAHCALPAGPCEEAVCIAHVCGTEPTPAGFVGNPPCAPFVCDGISPACPASCVQQSQCSAGHICQGGTCVSGTASWSVYFPSSTPTIIAVTNVVIDHAGDVILQGTGWGNGTQKWVLKLDGTNGVAAWFVISGINPIEPLALDVDGANNVVTQWGRTAPSAQWHVEIERLSPPGNALLNKGFGASPALFARGIAADVSGLMFAQFETPTWLAHDYGGGPETGARLVRFDASGTYLGSHTDARIGRRIAGMISGYVLGGRVETGGLDVGCGPMTQSGATFFASRHSSSGACLWQTVIDGGPASPETIALAVDGSDHVVIALTSATTVDLGGGPLPPVGATDVVVGVFDAAGAHQWSQRFPSSDAQLVALDAGANGHLLLSHTGSVDFGTGPVTGKTVLTPQWSFGGTVQQGGAAAMHPSGDIVVASGGAGISAARVTPAP